VSGSATSLLLVLIVAYLLVLARTGRSMFQRLFGMKRASATSSK